MEPKPRLPLRSDARTLPGRYYTDEAIYRAEMDRLFRRRWVAVGREDQVPAPGDYVLVEIADESLIVTRDRSGTVRAFANVCRHRGTRLCSDPEGSFRSTITCPYHAWTYDLEGELVGAPHMEGIPGFRKEDYPLYRVGASSWAGHLFVNLAEERPPLEDQLADLPAKFGPWGMEDLRPAERIVYDVRANWKLIVQNYSECLHCPVIHPAFQGLSHYLSGDSDAPHPSYLGGRNDLREGVDSLSMDGRRCAEVLEGLSGDDRRRVQYYAIFPNLLLSLHPDYVMTHTLRPRSPGRTEVVCEWLFHPRAIATAGFDPRPAVEFWNMTNLQDWRITEQAQLGQTSRLYTPGPYSDREDLLDYFDRIVVREADPRVSIGAGQRRPGRSEDGRGDCRSDGPPRDPA